MRIDNDRIDRELSDPEVHLILVENPRLDHLVRYVRKHLHERLTLARAAEVVGLERTYFSKVFHEITGCTFSEWNRAIRMERAAALLRLRNRSVRSIAFSVGYHDLTTFERAFKKCAGLSPSGYRAAYHERRRA